MTLEVLKALAVILEFCMNQDSCKTCPMAQFCGKMPCEWYSDFFSAKCRGSRLESNFRTGQVYRNKKPKWLNLLTLENQMQWEEL